MEEALYVARGRFRSGCVCGRAGRVPGARVSGLETTVFNVLDFVLACGRQDVPVPFDGRMNLDMLFEAVTGFRLGVEYDGGYWHEGREDADRRKTQRLVDSRFVDEVMRIREAPLAGLGPLDLVVSHATPGQDVAVQVLLHLAHTVGRKFGDETDARIQSSLHGPGRTIEVTRLSCEGCRWEAGYYGSTST